ncbi:DUF551 domain-containing protein [Cronobacter sakazakii]
MSTISNERLEKLSEYDCADRYEVMSMATELLALRKERERAEPVAWLVCGSKTFKDRTASTREVAEQAVKDRKDGSCIKPLYTAPTAQEYPETLPCPVILEPNFRLGKGVRTATMLRALQTRAEHQAELDAMTPEQRAEYEARMDEFKAMLPSPSKDSMSVDAQQAETDTTAKQFESLAGKAVVPAGWKLVPIELTKEMRGKIHPFAEATCLNCGRQVVADCEDNVTASWNDMLAVAPAPVGKQSSTADVNNDGFECTPVADLYELLTKCGECYDYTTSAKVAADWIKEGYSAREYVKLDRLQEAMTHGSSGEPDGWIPCSERMPDLKQEVLCVNRWGDFEVAVYDVGYITGEPFFATIDGEFHPTHWQPLPEPQCK